MFINALSQILLSISSNPADQLGLRITDLEYNISRMKTWFWQTDLLSVKLKIKGKTVAPVSFPHQNCLNIKFKLIHIKIASELTVRIKMIIKTKSKYSLMYFNSKLTEQHRRQTTLKTCTCM